MRTRDDIFKELLVRNNLTTTDTFITDTILQKWYSQANIWATSFHKWPFTEGKASTTYTTAITDDFGNAIIQYPEGWKADSIRILTIGAKRMQKLEFNSFLRYIENNGVQGANNNNSRIYSDYARQIYVNTGADVSGTLVAYGQYQPAIDVTDENGLSVFSDYDEEGNEAILWKMTAYLHSREQESPVLIRGKPVSQAIIAEQNAINILDGIWKRIGDEQFNYQTKDQSMFDHIDVLRGRGSNNNYNDRWRENQF